MGADLVGPSGQQTDAAKSKGTIAANGRHIGDDLFVSCRFVGVHFYLIAFFAVLQPSNMSSGRRSSDGDGQVLLFSQSSRMISFISRKAA